MLLFIDFEKAFNSLEWSFVNHTLQYFGFGSSLTNWVRTFYSNIESCILNNAWSSDVFTLQRRVRQGCPLSPYLFILSAEVLGKSIRANSRIKGVAVNNTEIKLSQYADDTTLILHGEQESLSVALNTIDNFTIDNFVYASGLKLKVLLKRIIKLAILHGTRFITPRLTQITNKNAYIGAKSKVGKSVKKGNIEPAKFLAVDHASDVTWWTLWRLQ